jgi:hypothetical protein
MKVSLIILGFVFISCGNLISQINYDKIRKYKLRPAYIDTLNENTLIIHKKNAVLIFRQSDIKTFLEQNSETSSGKVSYPYLNAMLKRNEHKIILMDWWSDYTEEERSHIFKKIIYDISDDKTVEELYSIGGDLIYYGKFMVIDNKTKKLITKGLKIIRVKGLYGTRYVNFRLPNSGTFWSIVTRLGE